MKECINLKKNMQGCNCTYEPCERKGRCCECLSYSEGEGRISGLFLSG